MPGRKRAELNQALCFRCQEHPPLVKIRNDLLCKICFDKYVSAKVVKRLEGFRVRQLEETQSLKTLLVALSCGPCSCALLHLMQNQLQRQRDQSGRVAYQIHALHIEGAPGNDDRSNDVWKAIQAQYPDHTYSAILFDSLPIPSELVDPLQQQTSSDVRFTTVASVVSSLHTATAQADFARILLRKSITKYAMDRNCDAVIWGDSTTTMAARVLAETAKGRGLKLPWVSVDGDSSSGIPYHYPMRDLLSKEIFEYILAQGYEYTAMLTPAEAKPAVSTKKSNIDHLMKQYFESVDREYPSIVTNVVKTTEKLRRDVASAADMECELCAMPLNGNSPERSRLCNDCVRTLAAAS